MTIQYDVCILDDSIEEEKVILILLKRLLIIDNIMTEVFIRWLWEMTDSD